MLHVAASGTYNSTPISNEGHFRMNGNRANVQSSGAKPGDATHSGSRNMSTRYLPYLEHPKRREEDVSVVAWLIVRAIIVQGRI